MLRRTPTDRPTPAHTDTGRSRRAICDLPLETRSSDGGTIDRKKSPYGAASALDDSDGEASEGKNCTHAIILRLYPSRRAKRTNERTNGCDQLLPTARCGASLPATVIWQLAETDDRIIRTEYTTLNKQLKTGATKMSMIKDRQRSFTMEVGIVT